MTKISLATSAFNVVKNDFDIEDAVKNWSHYVDEIVIATIPSEDDTGELLNKIKNQSKIKVKIIELDLNSIYEAKKKYDIIISNPPYLHPSEKNQLDKNVKYEPDIALFTPKDNPLHYYQKILVVVLDNL